jgi:beta-phosphoglucomutase
LSAETFLKCAEQLHLYPWECVVFEDSPKGVEAAASAGMKSVVITTMSGKEEFKAYDNIISFIPDYRSLTNMQRAATR